MPASASSAESPFKRQRQKFWIQHVVSGVTAVYLRAAALGWIVAPFDVKGFVVEQLMAAYIVDFRSGIGICRGDFERDGEFNAAVKIPMVATPCQLERNLVVATSKLLVGSWGRSPKIGIIDNFAVAVAVQETRLGDEVAATIGTTKCTDIDTCTDAYLGSDKVGVGKVGRCTIARHGIAFETAVNQQAGYAETTTDADMMSVTKQQLLFVGFPLRRS